MNKLPELIRDVSIARKNYLDTISSVSEVDARWKPTEEAWNITELTEHLFWAEQGAIFGMWKTIHAIREGSIGRSYESVHKNMSVEQVVALTWQPKEKVPAVAAPRLGGPLSFWKASLNGLQDILEAFAEDLKGDELRLQAHLHPISGPLDFQQRLEFLRFHIHRHRDQASELLKAMSRY